MKISICSIKVLSTITISYIELSFYKCDSCSLPIVSFNPTMLVEYIEYGPNKYYISK